MLQPITHITVLNFGTHTSADLLLQCFISLLVLFFGGVGGGVHPLWDGGNLKDYLKICSEVNHCNRKIHNPQQHTYQIS